jgi:hypothetical protein
MNKLFDSLVVRNHLPEITASLVMGAALNVFSLAAVAQTAQAPMDAGIEAITVTAEKRSTPLQETPVAVTALTADKLAWACNECQKCRFRIRICPQCGLCWPAHASDQNGFGRRIWQFDS